MAIVRIIRLVAGFLERLPHDHRITSNPKIPTCTHLSNWILVRKLSFGKADPGNNNRKVNNRKAKMAGMNVGGDFNFFAMLVFLAGRE